MPKLMQAALLLLLPPQLLLAQSIENVRATVQNDYIIIQYDLRTPIPDQEFTITLFSSSNNFSEALKQVSGDVGPNIKPGQGKSISWAAKAELGPGYKGQITFEVRGLPVVTVKPLELLSPAAGSKVKISKELTIEWTGGKPNDEVSLQLMQNGLQKGLITKTKNTGAFTWIIPKSTAKGEYQVLLLAGGNTAQSKPFQIKPKSSPLIFVLPVVVLGGVAYLLFAGDGGGETPPVGNTDLPDAPEPN